MEKSRRTILIVVLSVMAVLVIAAGTFALISLLGGFGDDIGDQNTGGGEENESSGVNSDDSGENKTFFIEDSRAKFSVIYKNEAPDFEKELARNIVAKLRLLGVEVSDARAAGQEEDEYELIIGTDFVRRAEEYNIKLEEIGPRGYRIKSNDKKIVIAAGSSEYADKAYKVFIEDVLKISEDTERLAEFYIDVPILHELITEYSVSGVSIAGNDLAKYSVFTDIGGMDGFEQNHIVSFRDDLFSNTGYLLPIANDSKDAEYKIHIRYVGDAGEEGFRAYVSESDLIIECSYANAFNKAFEKFVSEELFKDGEISFDADYVYTHRVSAVCYSDFGATGDDGECDYEAMYAAHAYANMCGQSVYAESGARYFIKAMPHGAIPVTTDVYLCDAEIIIDTADTDTPLFSLESKFAPQIYDSSDMPDTFDGCHLSKEYTIIAWISKFVEEDSLVKLYGEKDGVKYIDFLLVDTAGRINTGTPILHNMDSIYRIEVYNIFDEPLVFSGGKFSSSLKASVYIRRSNVLLKDITVCDKDAVNNNPFIEFSSSIDCRVENSEVSLACTACAFMNFEKIGFDEHSAAFILLNSAKTVEISNSFLASLSVSGDTFGIEKSDNVIVNK